MQTKTASETHALQEYATANTNSSVFRFTHVLPDCTCVLFFKPVSTIHLSSQLILFFAEPFEDIYEDHGLFKKIKENANFPKDK